MRFPKFLKEKDTIGFVAPSFGCNIEPYKTAFLNAQSIFQSMGFSTELGPNCYAGEGIGISNTPKACGKELTDFYLSTSNQALISCGGGELMCEILDYVDFERLKKSEPKWFLGYSDNTNFTFLSTTLLDTAALYSPCAAAFGMQPWHPAIQDTFDLLTGKKTVFHGYPLWEKESLKSETNPLATYHVTEARYLKVYDEALAQGLLDAAIPENSKRICTEFQGRLIGGCMDCLVNLLGTGFDHVSDFLEKYKEDGFIWFLEACDLNVMAIRRALWQMEHAGWFRYCKGFLIGRPLQFGQELMGLNQYDAVTANLSKYHVPILMDIDLGHLPPAIPIVSGSMAKVRAYGNQYSVEMLLR